ncbi:MAG: hypothetical protein GKR89_22825 [Candidatus Latescibacteria bacterium]|nr:hypothetical protein [Candidatus Latescibacterota bacterium]
MKKIPLVLRGFIRSCTAISLCLALVGWGGPAIATKDGSMQKLDASMAGRPLGWTSAAFVVDGQVWIPVHLFSAAVGAEAKVPAGLDQLAVCRGDLCIPLGRTQKMEEVVYAPLEDVAAPLGVKGNVVGTTLVLDLGLKEVEGLGVGDRPPSFALPDLYSGETIAVDDFTGKKTAFYMWASW